MDTFDVNVEKRIVTGKSAMRKLKSEGFVPGVLYSKDENIQVSLEERKMAYILNKHGKDVFLNINFDGAPVKVKIQEVQRDPVSQDIRHIDLMPLDDKSVH